MAKLGPSVVVISFVSRVSVVHELQVPCGVILVPHEGLRWLRSLTPPVAGGHGPELKLWDHQLIAEEQVHLIVGIIDQVEGTI
ncbi:hypothetical protein NL676_038777 [Syzygium grande]|nr:hypothetical protein NL676_038777 [Syzygium grande]